MGFRRGNDNRVMVYTHDNKDYVMGEYLSYHPMQFCIEEVIEDGISRIRLPLEVVEYAMVNLNQRRPLEYRRENRWCTVTFTPDGVDVAEGYVSPEGAQRHRRATFSVVGFFLACTLCRLAQVGNDLIAGEPENGSRPMRAEGLVGGIPEGWTARETDEPVVL